jgi:radical SAM superfamily enzyme YgiQ (UPF0313 family)
MTWEIRKLHDAVLSREIGAARKDWGGRLRIALVYPNRYAAGMSNLGFLSIHARINARPDALCERLFLPEPRERRLMERRRVPLTTLESSRPLYDFDVVAFSLSYENDLVNAKEILSAGGVPPFRRDREAAGGRFPLVLAGGFAASLNPEPAGTMADAVVVGDGERAAEAVLDLGAPRPGEGEYLKALAAIPGMYVPAGYVPEYRPPPPGAAAERLVALTPRRGFPVRVARESVLLKDCPPLPVVLAEDTEFGNMALVETSRGCPRLCAFCAAAHACPSFREFPLEHVRAAVDAAWEHRKKIGLIGAAVLDWRPFRVLAREILERGGTVSPASVRADLVDEEIADILKRSGHRTVALAPECGRADLRARIGKRIEDEVFFSAARTLARAGIVSFKLYFLVGLPGTDRDEEVEGTVSFLHAFREALLREGKRLGRMGTFMAVLSPFVPKPFTPLQWAPMAPEPEVRLRQETIAGAARKAGNVRVTAETPREAVLQAYLGLSDRRVEDSLARMKGSRLPRGGAGRSIPLEEVVFREKEADECLPWDVIDGGLPKEILRRRYERIVGR